MTMTMTMGITPTTMPKLSLLPESVEKALLKISIKAQNIEPSTHATTLPGLLSVENSALLSQMPRHQYLVLSCYFPSLEFNEQDRKELQHFIIQNIIFNQHWYHPNQYYASKQFKTKIDGLIVGIICQITAPQIITAKRIYLAMGIKQAKLSQNMGNTPSKNNPTSTNVAI